MFEQPPTLENALERNDKNGNVNTEPKFLSETISAEQGDH